MMRVVFLLIGCFSLFTVIGQVQNHNIHPLMTGHIHTFHSAILGEERVINVTLPQDFDPAKTYPFMYVLDGSYDEDFVHISGLVQFYNLMFGMPETIVVGIANVDRKRDFTHHTDIKKLLTDFPTTGHSEKFIRALREEIIPLIESEYRYHPTRYLVGQSLGGLVATEILLKYPSTFSHYLITSPSLWWDEGSLLASASNYISKFPDENRFIYIAVGADEEKIMIRQAEELASLLENKGNKKLKVEYNIMTGENHATILHNSIYQALNILFPFK